MKKLFGEIEEQRLTIADWIEYKKSDLVLVCCVNATSPICKNMLALLKAYYHQWRMMKGGAPCVVVCNLESEKNQLREILLKRMLDPTWISIHRHYDAKAIHAQMKDERYPGIPRMMVMKADLQELVDVRADKTLQECSDPAVVLQCWRGSSEEEDQDAVAEAVDDALFVKQEPDDPEDDFY